jgi:hypothetical protein
VTHSVKIGDRVVTCMSLPTAFPLIAADGLAGLAVDVAESIEIVVAKL